MGVLEKPYVEWNKGGSRLKASRGSDGHQVGGGKRGVISGFSDQSRRRMLQMIASIDRAASLPLFLTQTYPAEFPGPQKAKFDEYEFWRRAKREFSTIGAIHKIEPQDRGAPHFHSLVWGVLYEEFFPFVCWAWHDIAGGGDIKHSNFMRGLYPPYRRCVEPVKSFKGVWWYAAKYIGKPFIIDGWNGIRFWGVVNKQNIPFGKFKAALVDEKDLNEILRYQRRFSRQPYRSAQGFTVFCDADQWVEKLEIGA